MPSACLSGSSGCGHKRWLRVRVRVPAVAVLGCSLFWFLFLVWAPMHLDCRVRHAAGGGSGGSASGSGSGQEEERAREDAAWVVATGALDESVVMEVVQPQGGGASGGGTSGGGTRSGSARSFRRRRRRRRRKVLAVLGLHTGFDALQRRKSLRETWVPSTPQGTARQREATGLLIKFVIGRTPDAAKMATLEDEAEVFKDFIFLDVEESAHMGVTKSLAYFKAAYELYDADFYVKADDNIYLRPDRLSVLLAKDRRSPRTYLGCMKNGIVVQDSKHKWYEPQYALLGKEYFYHAYGTIYALSAEVVGTLASARTGSLRMFSNEDVTMGAWMLAMNVEYEDNRALCDPACHNNSVAVWDIPKCPGLCDAAVQLPELHKLDMCSKTPTLPNPV